MKRPGAQASYETAQLRDVAGVLVVVACALTSACAGDAHDTGGPGETSDTGAVMTSGQDPSTTEMTGARSNAGAEPHTGTRNDADSSTTLAPDASNPDASGPDASSRDAAGRDAGGADLSECERTDLEWRSARKTHYTSYPDPGSVECIEYNGCTWAGYFAGCDDQQPEQWVQATDIAAVFPDFDDLAHHRLCLRSGDLRMIVHVVDTCGDADCDGCCTRNQGSTDQLIDLESYTNARWGLPDSQIEWADLGPSAPTCP